MTRLLVALASLTAITLATSAAAADPLDDAPLTQQGASVGFRVGGYGFRREGDPRPGSGWNECRMNGIGVFAQHGLRGALFVEGGLDAYSTQDFILSSPSTDIPIDRMSGLVSGALGVRSRLTPWLRAYAQLGGGVELTRLSVPYEDMTTSSSTTIRADKALPEGFFGIGGDLRIASGTYAGASLRLLVMGNFDYSAARLQAGNQWVMQPTPGQVFAASPDFAMQGQFYVRRDL